jgi:hypothetical protein
VATAKPFVVTILVALAVTGSALADAPSVKLTSADQARAKAALLRRSDLGMGWAGGQTKPDPLTPPDCPGFSPKESDLVVTGHADAVFKFGQLGVELDQDVQVLATESAVETDFARTISPGLGRCLAYQLKQLAGVSGVTVTKVAFPQVGSVSAAYRATLSIKTARGVARLVSDYVFFAQGRMEYEFTVIAPASTRDQLTRFETGLAQILLRRAGAQPA